MHLLLELLKELTARWEVSLFPSPKHKRNVRYLSPKDFPKKLTQYFVLNTHDKNVLLVLDELWRWATKILYFSLISNGRAHSTKKYGKDTSIIQLHNGMFYEIQKSQQ